jgi:hypothetical protein
VRWHSPVAQDTSLTDEPLAESRGLGETIYEGEFTENTRRKPIKTSWPIPGKARPRIGQLVQKSRSKLPIYGTSRGVIVLLAAQISQLVRRTNIFYSLSVRSFSFKSQVCPLSSWAALCFLSLCTTFLLLLTQAQNVRIRNHSSHYQRSGL